MAKLDKVQAGQSFNSLGKSEIPEIVITELLVNAIVHRDYFIHDSIKLFVFENRVEIISPGKLPNGLTEEQIKKGVLQVSSKPLIRDMILKNFEKNTAVQIKNLLEYYYHYCPTKVI